MPSTTKMSVDISSFKQGIAEATAQVKTLDAQMKKVEATFKQTGDAETYMTQKAQTLEAKLKAQKDAVTNLQRAMQAMRDSGVSETSTQYQRLAERLETAQAAMITTSTELDNLGKSEQEASKGADQLSSSLGGISKKISLEQVIGGIDRITGGLERAAGKALELGKNLWDNVMDSARWADDTSTMALMYGVDLDTFLRVQKLVAEGMDTSVEAILNSQSRLKRNIGNGSSEFVKAMKELGVTWEYLSTSGRDSLAKMVPRDADEVFWEVGQAIMNLSDANEKEAKANAVFGKSWKELVPLFDTYKSLDEYRAALEKTTTNTEEEVSKLAELNDAVGKLQSNFDTLKNKVMAGLAPALTDASNALSGLLDNVIKYLETDEGQQALADMSAAVSGLFDDLGKIDPQQVVEGFTSVFGTIVDGLKWLDKNKDVLGGALTTIVGGWAAAKITGGALTVVQLVNGIRGLSAGAAAASAGAAAGASWGGAFASAVAAAAPWLVGIYTLLNPDLTKNGNNDVVDQNGNLTEEGRRYGYKLDKNGEVYQDRSGEIAIAVQEAWDLYRTDTLDAAGMMKLKATILNDTAFDQIVKQMYAESSKEGWRNKEDIDILDWLNEFEPPEIEVDPKAPDGAADTLAEQIGPVSVPVVLVPAVGPSTGRIRKPGGWVNPDGFNANGLPFVPFDGYIAELHRGERVMTATENRNYTFNSNTYFGNVNLNNGMQVEALSESIARQNRKIQRGYGS